MLSLFCVLLECTRLAGQNLKICRCSLKLWGSCSLIARSLLLELMDVSWLDLGELRKSALCWQKSSVTICSLYLFSFKFFSVIFFSLSLRPLDVEFMRRLSKVVNIVPVIAKADTLTLEERDFFKKKVAFFFLHNINFLLLQFFFVSIQFERILNVVFIFFFLKDPIWLSLKQ